MAAGNETNNFVRDGSMLKHHIIDTTTTPNSWKPTTSPSLASCSTVPPSNYPMGAQDLYTTFKPDVSYFTKSTRELLPAGGVAAVNYHEWVAPSCGLWLITGDMFFDWDAPSGTPVSSGSDLGVQISSPDGIYGEQYQTMPRSVVDNLPASANFSTYVNAVNGGESVTFFGLKLAGPEVYLSSLRFVARKISPFTS